MTFARMLGRTFGRMLGRMLGTDRFGSSSQATDWFYDSLSGSGGVRRVL
jgi:hypothetical protein